MPTTKTAPLPAGGPARVDGARGLPSPGRPPFGGDLVRATRLPRSAEAIDRDQLLDRLHQLRTILPVFAQELAGVRRVAARLRSDNQRLQDEVRRLRREQAEARFGDRATSR